MYQWGVISIRVAINLLLLLLALSVIDHFIMQRIYSDVLEAIGNLSLVVLFQGILVIIMKDILEYFG